MRSVEIARGEGPENVSRFLFAEPRSEPGGLDKKGDGRGLRLVPAAFLLLLDGRQLRNDGPGLAQ